MAISTAKELVDGKMVEYWTVDGHSMTLVQWAESLGICVHTLYTRIFKARRGIGPMNIEEVFIHRAKQPPNPKVAKNRDGLQTIRYDGATRTLSEWSARTGIDVSTIWHRHRKLMWTAAQTLGYHAAPARRSPRKRPVPA